MIYGRENATAKVISSAKSSVLLGFNEPDHPEQGDLSVVEALELWPRLMASGKRLGSPAAAGNILTKGWQDLFMYEAQTRGFRILTGVHEKESFAFGGARRRRPRGLRDGQGPPCL